MSNLIAHAKREMEISELGDNLYGEMLPAAVLELLTVFSKQGHSGLSAKVTIELFSQLAKFETLSPLTGEEDEWYEVSDGIYQNMRCSHVFKENGQAYDIDGIIWEDPDGSRWTNFESRVIVQFPYVPKSEIRKR